MFGKLLSLPVRLLNVPMRAVERIVAPQDPDPPRLLSQPLESVAEAIEEATKTTREK